ncbi:type IV toxin-antitoxin system AbiEi family antitoxin [Oleiharenicola sp. Vm1]|uniref:type IV toxin-antitoxin system AbiEi family antitoxin n=1 Tax=Oleiharenicola sp. Vm1 TaxID=3398393 RepID=UPI0039F4E9E5
MYAALRKLERHPVLRKKDIHKLFPEESEKTLVKSLSRMTTAGLLTRVARDLYINTLAPRNPHLLEEIARAARPGCFMYVSLESALSEHGRISQVPLVLTVMTDGSAGVVRTTLGTIEFTHTKRTAAEMLARSVHVDGRPLRVATPGAAEQDLRRVGRNVNMLLDQED